MISKEAYEEIEGALGVLFLSVLAYAFARTGFDQSYAVDPVAGKTAAYWYVAGIAAIVGTLSLIYALIPMFWVAIPAACRESRLAIERWRIARRR